jgi:DNA invertase Pin-like site-specific DNA recombinase
VKLVAYLRVSTAQQAEHGMGLDLQRATIKEWCNRCGHTVALWETDEGVSGSHGLEARIGLYSALRAIEEGEASGLVVYRLDRLARDLILQETLLARLWQLAASVFSTVDAESESLDSAGGDPTRNLTRQILGAIAQYERALIVLRMRSGKLAKQVKGGYIGGRVPYGFDLTTDGYLEPNAPEREAIDLMVRRRAEGATLRAICSELDDAGHRPKSASANWYPATVTGILRRAEAGGLTRS